MTKSLSLAFLAGSFLILSSSQKMYSQDIDPKDMFIEAESYFLFEEYEDALPLYQRILRLEPNNYNVLYKIGICYLNNIYQQEKSVGYLKQATQHINPRYKDNNYKEKLAPLESHYYLGRAYHVNNRLEEALESYEHFARVADPEEYDLSIVEDDIAACKLAQKLLKEPVFFRPVNLGEPINTRFEESNAVISGDGNTLIFNRKLPFYTAVFLSEKGEGGQWSEPVNLTPEFGLDGNSYCTGISYFGDEIFVYRSDEYDGNIYSSRKKGEKWGALTRLNDHINTKYWESHASPSPDGKYLYFTSNREGGYGGLDIYRSSRGPNNEWGPAVNMGPVLNSPGNEETPFIASEGYTLFFSSQGHNTIGDYDILVSQLKSDGSWSKPVNMGVPLNTTGKDVFYAPLDADAFGLYALYDQNSSFGLTDIYRIEIYNQVISRTFTVSGSLDVGQEEKIPWEKVKVSLYDAESNELAASEMADKDGNFELKASQGDYNLVVEGPGLETYSQPITLNVGAATAMLAIPAIVLTPSTKAARATPVVGTPLAKKEEIKVKRDFYAVADSAPIPIELTLPKEAELSIMIYLEDSLVKAEQILTQRRRFTYFFRPSPGENTLDFQAIDPEGNRYETQVVVTFYPPLEEPVAEIREPEPPEPGMQGSYIGWVASMELLDYLEELRLEEFEDYFTLYDHLVDESDKAGYTVEDVNEMYAILFTQMDLIDFDKELQHIYTDTTGAWDGVRDDSRIPIEYLQTLQERSLISEAGLTEILLSLMAARTDSLGEMLNELGKYSRTGYSSPDSFPLPRNVDEVWRNLKMTEAEEAGHVLQLASTTTELNFFYQNLLLASEGSLQVYLKELDMDSSRIQTSIDLTTNLFEQEPLHEYDLEDLVRALEKASVNGKFYLSVFYEMLAETSSGNLKSELAEIKQEKPDFNTYEGLISYLIDQSKFKNYSRENIYSTLLELIEIKDVNEFAAKLANYNNRKINEALADTSLQYFSNPYELIQYLLSVSDQFDFSETDINNLLIRMILEQGMAARASDQQDEISFKIWRDNKFVATVVLVNLVLLVLLILYLYRRKSNR